MIYPPNLSLVRQSIVVLLHEDGQSRAGTGAFLGRRLSRQWNDTPQHSANHRGSEPIVTKGPQVQSHFWDRNPKLFDDAGVRMMVGTDGGGQAPGQSIHQEFDELAKAGLAAFKILQMTTLNPAEFLRRTATMGSMDVGKNADIVLLNGNPVESVQNLHRISGVVRAGFYYSQADLDALRARAKEPRARPRT